MTLPQSPNEANRRVTAASPAPDRARYPLVQVLRAAAALSVAIQHFLTETMPHDWPLFGVATWVPWAAGVDVFFVISGFVIIHAAEPLFRRHGAWRLFMVRRVARIVPLYWAATTLFLVLAALVPTHINNMPGDGWSVVASYLFVPAMRADGLVMPALSLGWTLNDEMFFYVVVAASIGLGRRPCLWLTALGLVVLVIAGRLFDLAAAPLVRWSDPIVLEFVFGLIIAGALRGRVALGRRTRAALAGLGIALLLLRLDEFGWPRPIAFGVPAVLAVAAATLGPPVALTGIAGRALLALGDASYAIYLLHPFAMRASGFLHPALLPFGPPGLALQMLTALVLTIAASLVVHRWFERPSNRFLVRVLSAERRQRP